MPARLALFQDLFPAPVGGVIEGSMNSETITGSSARDWITPLAGEDTIDGGAGRDMLSYVSAPSAVSVNLTTGQVSGGSGADQISNIEEVTGSIYGDYLVGDAGDNLIRGLGGYDWMVASAGADTYVGGSRRDMISYVFADTAVSVDLGAGRGLSGQALGDTYDSIERFTGSVFSDLAYGSDGADDFRGLGGYDWFVGSGGGKDRYDGGAGRDTVAYSLSGGAVTASLALGRGTQGDAARDLYSSIENLTGSSFDDTLWGDEGRNTLRGLYGEDSLYGMAGADRLMGGASDDYLDGGAGYDRALFAGNAAEYAVHAEGGFVFVTHLDGGRDGADQLHDIEVLVFADEMVFL